MFFVIYKLGSSSECLAQGLPTVQWGVNLFVFLRHVHLDSEFRQSTLLSGGAVISIHYRESLKGLYYSPFFFSPFLFFWHKALACMDLNFSRTLQVYSVLYSLWFIWHQSSFWWDLGCCPCGCLKKWALQDCEYFPLMQWSSCILGMNLSSSKKENMHH